MRQHRRRYQLERTRVRVAFGVAVRVTRVEMLRADARLARVVRQLHPFALVVRHRAHRTAGQIGALLAARLPGRAAIVRAVLAHTAGPMWRQELGTVDVGAVEFGNGAP